VGGAVEVDDFSGKSNAMKWARNGVATIAYQ
jgi:hypothetical protein